MLLGVEGVNTSTLRKFRGILKSSKTFFLEIGLVIIKLAIYVRTGVKALSGANTLCDYKTAG